MDFSRLDTAELEDTCTETSKTKKQREKYGGKITQKRIPKTHGAIIKVQHTGKRNWQPSSPTTPHPWAPPLIPAEISKAWRGWIPGEGLEWGTSRMDNSRAGWNREPKGYSRFPEQFPQDPSEFFPVTVSFSMLFTSPSALFPHLLSNPNSFRAQLKALDSPVALGFSHLAPLWTPPTPLIRVTGIGPWSAQPWDGHMALRGGHHLFYPYYPCIVQPVPRGNQCPVATVAPHNL